jgi:formylglycine-generating enzyme
MKFRLLAASTAGLLFQGLLLFRIGAGNTVPVAVRGALALGGQLGMALVMPRTASAAGSELSARKPKQGSDASDEARADDPAVDAYLAALSQEPPTGDDPANTAAPSTPPSEAGEGPTSCPAGMLLVEGEYCPEVRHDCRKWAEETGRYAYYRCLEYTRATCLSKERVHKRFCMDRDEYVPPGEKLPSQRQSWTDATRTCGDLGKRVCLESEWNFACEGEEMRPYPYGWKRDPEACNADRVDIYRPDGQLRDLREGADDKPRCVSPFGVHHLSGNLEEWTTIDASSAAWPPRPAMKGAYWQPSRNHCRAAQTAHDRFYKGTETGFRCCADPPPAR